MCHTALVPAVCQDFWGPLISLPASKMALKGQSKSQALMVLYMVNTAPQVYTTCLPGTPHRLSGQTINLHWTLGISIDC